MDNPGSLIRLRDLLPLIKNGTRVIVQYSTKERGFIPYQGLSILDLGEEVVNKLVVIQVTIEMGYFAELIMPTLNIFVSDDAQLVQIDFEPILRHLKSIREKDNNNSPDNTEEDTDNTEESQNDDFSDQF